MEAWYVAKTKPGKERWVKSYLTENWDIEVFFPVIRRPVSRKRGWEPLFPTYLFCFINPHSDHWPAIRWAPGLLYFLGVNHELVPIPGEVIAHLKQRVACWNEGGYSPRFAPGERVVVASGPFASLDGIFQKYVPSRQRCQVLLQIVGRLTAVELAEEALESASPYGALAPAT